MNDGDLNAYAYFLGDDQALHALIQRSNVDWKTMGRKVTLYAVAHTYSALVALCIDLTIYKDCDFADQHEIPTMRVHNLDFRFSN